MRCVTWQAISASPCLRQQHEEGGAQRGRLDEGEHHQRRQHQRAGLRQRGFGAGCGTRTRRSVSGVTLAEGCGRGRRGGVEEAWI